jgi:hypothetical protein
MRRPGPGPWAALAALVALPALAACGGTGDEEAGGPPSSAREATTAPVDTGSGTTTVPNTSPGATTRPEQEPEWASCTNRRWGYTLDHPAEWHTVALGPPTRCRWFAREPFHLEEGTEAPLVDLEVRRTMGTFQQAGLYLRNPFGERVLQRRGLVIDGRQAIRFEKEQTEDLLYPTGTKTYGYLLNRGGKAYWVLTLDVPGRSLPYESNKDVVDRVARSLSFH